MEKKLTRSSQDKYIAGVCGGLAEYFGFDSTIVRLIVIVLALPASSIIVLAYFFCWLFLPEAYTGRTGLQVLDEKFGSSRNPGSDGPQDQFRPEM